MQLSIYRYINTVAQYGNITKAAECLFISQPALSQAIRRAEIELNVALFYRDRNRVKLTPAGEIVAREGARILHIHEELQRQLAAFQAEKESHLSIGAAISYQKYYLDEVLSSFRGEYPGTKIIIQDGFSHNLCTALLEGSLDIALICEPVPADIYFMTAFHEEIYLALPLDHPLTKTFPADGSPYPVADLRLCRNEGFIAYCEGRRIADIFWRETRLAGFSPKVITECTSTESANSMVFHGMGVGLIPSATVALCPPERRARYYRIRPGGVSRRFGLARRAGREPTVEQAAFFSLAERLSERAFKIVNH